MTECSICLDDISEKTKNVVLNCSHIFHYDCMVKVTGNSCPLCRHEIISGGICKEEHSNQRFFKVSYIKKNGECRICLGKPFKICLDKLIADTNNL